MLNLPMALIGGILAIYISESPSLVANTLALAGLGSGRYIAPVISIASMVGFVTLFGIAVRNGILLVNHYSHLQQAEGCSIGQSIVQGSMERLVPILMTALTAALGHIPLAIAALQALRARTEPWYGIIGHSFGGAIAPALIGGLVEGQPAIEISRLVLIAAPHSMPRIFHGFGEPVGLTARSAAKDANTNAGVARGNGREVSLASAEAQAAAGDHVTLKVLPVLATGESPMRRQPCRLRSNSWPGDGPHSAALRTPRRT
jgi:hypothetical protein